MSTQPSSAGAPAPLGAAQSRMVRRIGIGVWSVIFVLLALVPVIEGNPTFTSIGVFTLIFMSSASAWNGFSGYSGYISLGNGVFYGTGAYALTVIALDAHMAPSGDIFWLVPLAGLIAAIIAVPFGFIALRVRRHTFVVITIAIFFVFQLLAYNFSFTGGSAGLLPPTPNWVGNTYNDPFYYVAFAVLVFTVLLFWGIRRSRFGLHLLAIRDDEDRARGLGVKVLRIKMLGFVLSAFVTGMGGAIFAFFIGQVYPQYAFDPVFGITVALMTFFGGIGTISGPLLGALLLEPIEQYLTIQYSVGSLYLIIYGALFLLVILFMPRGLVPTIGDWRRFVRVHLAQRREKVLPAKGDAVVGDDVAGDVPAVTTGMQ
ncbi:MAG: branched-chain amino acid ABC transporter permease [Actinomycetota bacterium]|nr:branched-chain amino acid ABC transporter permease [Actinomycetota bacterium]